MEALKVPAASRRSSLHTILRRELVLVSDPREVCGLC